jgi:tetratricopeptide (TPR) repeat protein
MEDQFFEFSIAVSDFDTSRLPQAARRPGTDEFAREVTKLIESDYAPFEGQVSIRVDPRIIHVRWKSGPSGMDPLSIAIAQLQKGNYPDGVNLLQTLRRHQPQHPAILFNLGMAQSDVGNLEDAVNLLEQLVRVRGEPNDFVALGVAHARRGNAKLAKAALSHAVEKDGANGYAHRNLGAVLLRENEVDSALLHLRQATDLLPNDPQAWFGLGQAAEASQDLALADEAYKRVLELKAPDELAELARDGRRRIAGESFRTASGGMPRPDALMYCLGALQKFAKMPESEVQRIVFEIVMLGRGGLDVNDPTQKYTLKTLPGKFSGLHLVSIMYVGMKQIAPQHDPGFDLSAEYAAAKSMFDASSSGG